MVEVQDTTLNVRVGDSAQLSAFVPGVPAGEGNVTIWVSRDAAPSTERVIPANRAAVYTFSAPGQYSITAQYSDVAGSRIVGCVVNAISAEFGEAVETYVDRGRELALPGVSYSLTLECDRDLVASDAAILADTTHKIRITARQPGTHYIVARLHEDGPILARGTVSALQSVDAGVAADTEVISTYPDGDKLVRSGMVIDKLPTGGYAEVRIFVAGVTFEDGTTEQRFYDSDLDANGILYLNFNYPAATLTSVCHRVYIYSAQGELVGSL